MASVSLKSVNFEVFGRVQGVFFRKHTQSTAKKLGLMGWVENTNKGTVVGCVEGPGDKVSTMKTWLRETGSPESLIEKCVFTNEKDIDRPSFQKFGVRGF
ncbi:acylphosphatase-2 isoform X1 [Aplysia californica]|uniref:acylphosphatase n=1 Tax=Aplysia californica TaxID=6500 RepID=A0ABM0JUU8_APLCA|nr:acylphosphatase-2 isoform X1 [Aplysia californica]